MLHDFTSLLQLPLYPDNLTGPQNNCNANNDNEQELMQLTPEIDKLIELIKFTRLHASKIYQDIKMTDDHLLAAWENPDNGLFTLYQEYKGEQSSPPLGEKVEFARNIWKQCNAAFGAFKSYSRFRKHPDEGGNWILKEYEITLSDPNGSASCTLSKRIAAIANHRGFFNMRIIEQEEGEHENKIEELQESAKRRNEATGYKEIYPINLYNLTYSGCPTQCQELGELKKMLDELIKSVNRVLKINISKIYELSFTKLDVTRVIWEKCNSAFLEGKGVHNKETGYWLLEQHEIEFPFMKDSELFTKLKVSAIVNPKGYFNFLLTLPGEETKQNLTELLNNSECRRNHVRSAYSRQPEALQKLA